MVGLALLNFLVGRGQSASTARPHPAHGTPPLGTYLKNAVLLRLVHLAGQAAVRQGVVDDELVGLGAGLLVQPGTWGAG